MMRRTHDDDLARKCDRGIAEKRRDVKSKRPFACRLSFSRNFLAIAIPRACENRFRVISIIPFSGKNDRLIIPVYPPALPLSSPRGFARKADTCEYRIASFCALFPGSINQRHLRQGSPLKSDRQVYRKFC